MTSTGSRVLNLVLRGSVYQPEIKTLSKKAQDLFELSVESRILSTDELYTGKMCAALDRQHPRDLFDVHILLKNEGLVVRIIKGMGVWPNSGAHGGVVRCWPGQHIPA
jgi:hypothetical protein